MAMLEVQDLHVSYGSREILQGVTFSLEPGTLTGLLGINGSGKSTLMKALCGILPSRGGIRILDRDAGTLAPRTLANLARYIPQRTGISMDISVLDVVLMGFNPRLGLLEYPGKRMRKAACEALACVGLLDRAESNFQTLSEGQKQLCLLSRAMLLERGVLLLDEPESALDFSGRYRLLNRLRTWLLDTGSSALVSLHDPQLAINTCDRLLLLQGGVVTGELYPQEETPERMEQVLSDLYGSLSVHTCVSRSGNAQFVLLKED